MINETTHVFIMARGQGTRLHPLTKSTCKPHLSFGGQYRIIDFVLSNLSRAGIQNITVLIPFDDSNLCFHLKQHWPHVHTQAATNDVLVGNATSVLRALELNLDSTSEHIGIFPSDQVFHFELLPTLLQHVATGAKASILTRWNHSDAVSNFGVLRAENSIVTDFIEKPNQLPNSYMDNHRYRVNMGIYWFNRETLLQTLLHDEKNTLSSHDFGHDILPLLIKEVCTNMIDIDISHPWEDVGTIDKYWHTHWKYRKVLRDWDIRETISGSMVETGYASSPLPTSTKLDQCIIFENVVIGEYCNLKQVIIETGCILDSHLTISLETAIDGRIYKTQQCLIIPQNSLVQYNREREMVTVEQR